jgi:hypothetical protein
MQVIYRFIVALYLWSPMQHAEHCDLFTEVFTWLEDTLSDIFFQHGWQCDLRIDLPSH